MDVWSDLEETAQSISVAGKHHWRSWWCTARKNRKQKSSLSATWAGVKQISISKLWFGEGNMKEIIIMTKSGMRYRTTNAGLDSLASPLFLRTTNVQCGIQIQKKLITWFFESGTRYKSAWLFSIRALFVMKWAQYKPSHVPLNFEPWGCLCVAMLPRFFGPTKRELRNEWSTIFVQTIDILESSERYILVLMMRILNVDVRNNSKNSLWSICQFEIFLVVCLTFYTLRA